MKLKLILCLNVLLIALCGCSHETSDYESYFPNNEILFDDEDIDGFVDNYQSEEAVLAASYDITDFESDLSTADVNSSLQESTDEHNNHSAETVWIPKSGKKYHCKPNCSNMKSAKEVSIDEAIEKGYDACKRCYK